MERIFYLTPDSNVYGRRKIIFIFLFVRPCNALLKSNFPKLGILLELV